MRMFITGITAAAAALLLWQPTATAQRSSLSRGQIRAGIRSVRPSLKACGRHVTAAITIKMRIKVLPTGRVLRVRVSPASPFPRLDRCVERVVMSASFPRGVGISRFTYPFYFHPRRGHQPPPRRFAERPTPGDIRRGIRSVRQRLNGCLRHSRRPGPRTLNLRFRIQPNGQVSTARARGGGWRLRRCVQRAIKAITFPATRLGSFVRRPITLRNQPPPPRWRVCRINKDCAAGNFCRDNGRGLRICMTPVLRP